MILIACGEKGPVALPHEILFSSQRDGPLSIYALDIEASLLRRLTSIEGEDTRPALSPNRKQVAFLSDRNGSMTIWVMDTLGLSERLAFTAERGPVTAFFWAPDSRRISYEVSLDGHTDIFIGDVVTGKTRHLLIKSEQAQLGGWSPDGTWVLYAAPEGPEQGVHRKNPDGVDDVWLTKGPDANPRWAPNGRLIAFNRRAADGALHIAVVSPNGSDEKLLTKDGRYESDFQWSPDGSRLAFISDRDGNREVYVIGADGRRMSRLTVNQAAEGAPRWSKDGKVIAFVSDSDGDFDLYSMKPDGTRQVKLTDTDQNELDPYW